MTTDGMIDPATPTIGEMAAPGVAAVRRYWRPFLLLQGGALLLVVTYFAVPTVQRNCQTLSRWHERGGLAFSGVAAAIAGGLMPEAAKILVGRRRTGDVAADRVAAKTRRWNDIAFACCAFAVNGMITDLQYRGLGRVFGYDGSMMTSAKKMLADQFITTPVYGIVYWALVYRWRALHYSAPALIREINLTWYLRQVGPLLIPCWCFWIPMTLLVYSMPDALQFELFCVALAAWSLLMLFIATQVETPSSPRA